jgi:hypothetical protein
VTIQSKIAEGLVAAANSVRSIRSLVTGSNTGNLNGLVTTAKGSVVAAINELKNQQSLDVSGRWSFSLTDQPRRTWIQPTAFTQVFNTLGTRVSLASGNFTIATGSLTRSWFLYMQAEATSQDDIGMAAEIRLNGNVISRVAVGPMPTGSGLYCRATLSTSYRLLASDVITFHAYHNRVPPLLTTSNSNISGIVGIVML